MALQDIEHFVVLMMENRSFDNILGMLYPNDASRPSNFNGLTGNEVNPDNSGKLIRIQNKTDSSAMTTPTPDPGELWSDINEQLFGNPAGPANNKTIPTMNGFVANYQNQLANTTKLQNPTIQYNPQDIMNYFNPQQIPAISTLAREFAVCDQWFAAAPNQTWPNRFFVHTGTAMGYENNSPLHYPYEAKTIFTRFNEAGIEDGWKIYYHDFPQTLTLADLLPHFLRFDLFSSFQKDAMNGNLPRYSFIEPHYFTELSLLPSDMHPPHDVSLGDQLIATVYNILRVSPLWEKTLLVIIFDEHGGCYDHVPPPAAPPPELPKKGQIFAFDRYGVRIPAVLISPWIPKGTVYQKVPWNHFSHEVPPYPLDHTSIMVTLRKRWPKLGGPLMGRDAVAPDFGDILSCDKARTDCPISVRSVGYQPLDHVVERAKASAMNSFQLAMHDAAAQLPYLKGVKDVSSAIAKHIAAIKQNPVIPPSHESIDDGISFIKYKLDGFWG